MTGSLTPVFAVLLIQCLDLPLDSLLLVVVFLRGEERGDGWPCHTTCEIWVLWPEVKPMPLAVEAQSLNHWTFSEPGKPLIRNLDPLPTLSLIPLSFLSIDWKILILPLLKSHQQILWIQIWTLANFRDSEVWNLQSFFFFNINPDLEIIFEEGNPKRALCWTSFV